MSLEENLTQIGGELWILTEVDHVEYGDLPAFCLTFQQGDLFDRQIYAFKQKGNRFYNALNGLKRSIGKEVKAIATSNHEVRIDFADGSWLVFGE